MICLFVGFILGFIFCHFKLKSRAIGTLRVDSSNEDGPYLFLELGKPLSKVISQKYAMVTIRNKDYISQK